MAPEIARMFSLEGRVAVITGGGSGIGREIGRILGLSGAEVILGDVHEGALDEGIDFYSAQGIKSRARSLDVSDKAQVDALSAFAVAETGRLDIWINCAAVSPLHTLLETDPDEAQRTVAVNLFGYYWGCIAAGRIMAASGGGVILNISSAGGMKPLPNLAVYGMTKAAINSLTMTAAAELGPMGVRVNAIAPGFIHTPATAQLYRNDDGSVDPEHRDRVLAELAGKAPIGRLGHVSDIGLAALYLASDAASFVTGQIWRVNGGESM